MSSYSLNHGLSFASDHSNPKLIIPHNPKVPGVNLWLITTTRPHLTQVICLSLHPVRETLQSLLLLRPALCPLFNPVKKACKRGEQIDLLRGPYWQCFCCCGQCQALALHVWLGVSCWHHNKRYPGICPDAVFVDKPCHVFAYSSYLSPKHISALPQMYHVQGCPSVLSHDSHNSMYYTLRISFFIVKPVVMWDSSNVIGITSVDHFCSLQYCFPHDVTPDVDVCGWGDMWWDRAWIYLVIRKHWLVPLCIA